MDAKPFFEFNMLDIKEAAVEELKKFTKTSFDLNYILTTASELKYTREIKRILAEQMQEPSDEFVKFFAGQVYTGRMTQAVREQFAQLTKQAFKQVINDQINERLKTALASDPTVAPSPTEVVPQTNGTLENTLAVLEPVTNGVVTSEDETEAFHIIRAILRETVSVKRVVLRDVQSYCGILLDDNNRKPICRLRFNGTQKAIGFFTGQHENAEERVLIATVDDIYKHAERLKATVARYDEKAKPEKVAA